MNDYEYDVAFSFAGENRAYVRCVAELLAREGIKVFYDEFENVELWGKDLAGYLDRVFRTSAKYCVIFISEFYFKKAWTNHERKSALSRAIQEKAEYILPARFDDTEIPGIQPSIGYIDLRKHGPSEFGQIIKRKIGIEEKSNAHSDIMYRIPKVGDTEFNPYVEAISFMNQVKGEIEVRGNSLSDEGVSVAVYGHDQEHKIRIVHGSDTVYSLDMKLGGSFNDRGISFYGVRGMPISAGSFNATGTFEGNPESGNVELKLNDMSLFETFGGEAFYTTTEFINRLWDVICDALENH